jgi:hypothetical protein
MSVFCTGLHGLDADVDFLPLWKISTAEPQDIKQAQFTTIHASKLNVLIL